MIETHTHVANRSTGLVIAARELRDRWPEEVYAANYLPLTAGKYELGRRLITEDAMQVLLPHESGAIAA